MSGRVLSQIKRLTKIESKISETIYIKIQISSKKWSILFIYWPQKYKKNDFFNEISNSLNKISSKYENILLTGYLNIDIQENTSAPSHLSNLNDDFNLKNT